MDTTKFINKEMALMAATTAYIAAVNTGHFAQLNGPNACDDFTLDVYLEPEELFTLPSGYVYSGIEEQKCEPEPKEYPPFKIKMYIFKF